MRTLSFGCCPTLAEKGVAAMMITPTTGHQRGGAHNTHETSTCIRLYQPYSIVWYHTRVALLQVLTLMVNRLQRRLKRHWSVLLSSFALIAFKSQSTARASFITDSSVLLVRARSSTSQPYYCGRRFGRSYNNNNNYHCHSHGQSYGHRLGHHHQLASSVGRCHADSMGASGSRCSDTQQSDGGSRRPTESFQRIALTTSVHTEMSTVESQEDGHGIPIKIWSPLDVRTTKPTQASAVVFFIHGWMFSQGDYDSHETITRALVKQLRMTVVTATFRDGSVTTHETGKTLQDLKSLAAFSQTLSTTASVPFGVMGSSSGGYFALEVMRQLACTDADADAGAKPKPGHGIDFCIPLCPVSHPQSRAVYLQHCIAGSPGASDRKDIYDGLRHPPQTAQYILDTQMQYWETNEVMEIAGQDLAECWKNDSSSDVNTSDDEATRETGPSTKIPTLLILASRDKNVPLECTRNVMRWMTKTVIIGDAGHEISDVMPSDSSSFIPDIDLFLREHVNGWELDVANVPQTSDDGSACAWPF